MIFSPVFLPEFLDKRFVCSDIPQNILKDMQENKFQSAIAKPQCCGSPFGLIAVEKEIVFEFLFCDLAGIFVVEKRGPSSDAEMTFPSDYCLDKLVEFKRGSEPRSLLFFHGCQL